MELQKTLRPILMASAILGFGVAQAATNPPAAGATSTGDTTITLTKADLLQISALEDIPLVLGADGGAAGTTPACIYRAGTPAYNLIATGDGDLARTGDGGGSTGGNFFTLYNSGATSTIAYTVSFETGGTTVPLTTNTAVTGLAAHSELDCGADRTNATFTVAISQADYIAAEAGAYTGVLTLLVSPE